MRPTYVTSRTPLRVSLVGGGSDIPTFYSRYPGKVVSFAISKYIYVNVRPNNSLFGDKYRVSYSVNEHVNTIDEIENGIVRESLNLLDLDEPLYISTSADIPSNSGLGSSSSFAVGLLNALHAYKGEIATSEQLAREACVVEIEKLKKPIGKQDQYAAAYGGLNSFEFNLDGSVNVVRIPISDSFLELLSSACLVWTGQVRDADTVLANQAANQEANFEGLRKMVLLADSLHQGFMERKFQVEFLAECLNLNWKIKKTLGDKITTSELDALWKKCLQNGSVGGKLLGAGGGGFFLNLVPVEQMQKFFESMLPNVTMPIGFSQEGTRLISLITS
jgi:D-glycero-alpha-D-manno-heptose-7-phosphate kinase